MDFQKKDLIEFLNISLQVEPGNKCGEQSRAVNKLPRFYDGLNVKASVGMGLQQLYHGYLLLDITKKLLMAFTRYYCSITNERFLLLHLD